MGMDQSVTFAAGTVPAYTAVRDRLAERGFPLQVRMINGELAFPDELPPEPWRELRLGTPLGIVTLRREGDRITFVTWGNADAALLQAWNALTWAFADVGGGQVEMPAGPMRADDFQRTANLPAVLRTS